MRPGKLPDVAVVVLVLVVAMEVFILGSWCWCRGHCHRFVGDGYICRVGPLIACDTACRLCRGSEGRTAAPRPPFG